MTGTSGDGRRGGARLVPGGYLKNACTFAIAASSAEEV